MAFDPYAAPRPLFQKGSAPTHVVTAEDKDRLQSYDLYENIYHNVPNTFKVSQRGNDGAPIYLPSPRGIIEACNRFLAVDFGYLITADNDQVKLTYQSLIATIFKREEFFTKFATQKRYGLVRGDAYWHITADPEKAPPGQGQTISIEEVHPSQVFPITEVDDADKTIGYHLVEIILDPDDANKTKTLAKRQTYRKQEDGTITSELMFFEPDKWDDRNLKESDIKRVSKPQLEIDEFTLPQPIRALPVYQIKNNRISGFNFGISELLGIERVMGAVNQAVSDEELALAVGGLGVYWTTSGPPMRDGAIVPWELGPNRMIEIAKESQIGRLAGIGSTDPSINHMKFMLAETQSSIGVPDVAAGKVDVQIAESGIALLLQMSPLLAKNAEKEGEMIGKYDQMFHDLVKMWLPAFEGTSADDLVAMVAVAGDPMPQNRKAKIDEIIALVTSTPPLLSLEEGRRELVKLGYDALETTDGSVSADPVIDQERALAAARDPFADRLATELSGNGNGQSANAGVGA